MKSKAFENVEKLNTFVSVKNFGAKGDGITNDYAAISAALAVGGTIVFPPGVYLCPTTTGLLEITQNNTTIYGYGATILNSRLRTQIGVVNTTINGLHLLDNRADSQAFQFDFRGDYLTLNDVFVEKAPVAGAYHGYFRNCNYVTINNIRARGSNGFFVQGHDYSINNQDLVGKGVNPGAGGDDAWALKAAATSSTPIETYNIAINGGNVSGYFGIVSIGSEVGLVSATGDYSSYVKNVTVTNVNAFNCTTLVYIKPGALSPDYRNGLVENIVVSNCTLYDPEGVMFSKAVHITAGRGAIVRDVQINNCVVRARCENSAVLNAGIYIRTPNIGDSATISRVHINNLSVTDNYNGVTNSVSAPGFPIEWAAYFERASATNDVIEHIYIDKFDVYGTQNGGIGWENSPQGPFVIRNSSLREIGVAPIASLSVINPSANTDVSFYDNVSIPSTSPSPNLLPIGQTGTLGQSFFIKAETDVCFIGSAAAGVAIENPFFIARRNCYVWKIELVNAAAITQNDTDYSTYEFRNMHTGNVLASATTKLTGGLAIPDDSPPVSISGTTALQGVNAYFPAGSVMRFKKADSGSGQPITNMYARVFYVPYQV